MMSSCINHSFTGNFEDDLFENSEFSSKEAMPLTQRIEEEVLNSSLSEKDKKDLLNILSCAINPKSNIQTSESLQDMMITTMRQDETKISGGQTSSKQRPCVPTLSLNNNIPVLSSITVPWYEALKEFKSATTTTDYLIEIEDNLAENLPMQRSKSCFELNRTLETANIMTSPKNLIHRSNVNLKTEPSSQSSKISRVQSLDGISSRYPALAQAMTKKNSKKSSITSTDTTKKNNVSK